VPLGLKSLLGLSLKFIPTPTNSIPSIVYKQALLPLFRQIRLAVKFKQNNESYNKLIYIPKPDYIPPKTHAHIEQFMKSTWNKACNANLSPRIIRRYNLNCRQRTLLRNLKGQKYIKIVQTDKNLGPAIMLSEQYEQFCMDHLSQCNTYERINDIPLAAIKNIIATYHTALCGTDSTLIEDSQIIIHGLDSSTPSYFHAFPKIHKTPMGCRPIVSSVNAPTTGLSKWLTFILNPIAAKIQSYVRDSDTLQREIIQLSVEPNDIMYTFDVENMYTSIPIEAAISAIEWFLQQRHNPPLFIQIILTGLRIVLNNNYFTFGDLNWKQLVGLAMGTPVAPTVATLYLGLYEETKIIPICRTSLRLYRRYLDDIFIILRPTPEKPFVFNELCGLLRQTPGLTWTHKVHTDQAIFLDLCIFRHGSVYATKTYQKAMNLYLYPTFNSAHAPSTKKGMIYGLLKKYKAQNTLPEDFHKISQALFQRFLARGYRLDTLRRLFQMSMEKLSIQSTALPHFSRRIPRQVFYKIPYDPNGLSRSQLRATLALDDLSAVLKEENIKITICYQKTENLGNILVRNKQPAKLPSTLATHVVQDSRVE